MSLIRLAILPFAVAACLAAGAPALAQAPTPEELAQRIISVPAPSAYRVDGVRTGARVRNDPRVQGGKALRVPVPGRSEQAWSVGIAVPITQAVRAGDNLILAFWARLEEGQDGATSATLPYIAVQMAGAPYTPLFNGPATIGPEWRMHELRGRATQDHAANTLNVAMHLATGRQTVDIGPVFVLNMGQ